MTISNDRKTSVDFREGDVSSFLEPVEHITLTKIDRDEEDYNALYHRTLTIRAEGQVLTLELQAADYNALRVFEEREEE